MKVISHANLPRLANEVDAGGWEAVEIQESHPSCHDVKNLPTSAHLQKYISHGNKHASSKQTASDFLKRGTQKWVSQKLLQIDNMQSSIVQALNLTSEMEKVIRERSKEPSVSKTAATKPQGIKASFHKSEKRLKTSSPLPVAIHSNEEQTINLSNIKNQAKVNPTSGNKVEMIKNPYHEGSWARSQQKLGD